MSNIHIKPLIVLLMLVATTTRALAQMERPVAARVQQALLRDDSLHITLAFDFDRVLMSSTRKLVLTPVLRKEGRELALPPVILTGRRRMLDDRRAWNVNPQSRPQPFPYAIIEMPGKSRPWSSQPLPWSGKRRYQASVPYASWMLRAELLLEEREMNCCDNWLLAFNLIDENLNLSDPCGDMAPVAPIAPATPDTIYIRSTAKPDTIYITNTVEVPAPVVEPEDVPLCVECTLIYIEFAQNKYDVRPDFSTNRIELAKVDSVVAHLPRQKCILYVCGYASPEGILFENEILARNRTESFAAYLKRNYRLPAHCTVETTSVGEDWEGLVKLLNQTGKPYAAPSLHIIQSFGVLNGREKHLMDLEQGHPYRDMLHTLFPYLRRIELRVRLVEEEEAEGAADAKTNE